MRLCIATCLSHGHSRIYFDTHFNGFTPLSPADQDTERAIDCVVVPGWGGHALGSFRSHTSPYVWLRDSLPRHCPELRIWTYGYQSQLTNSDSSADVYEFAERFRRRLRILRQQTKGTGQIRPLIFMVHSLGGWIFKDAMIQMKESSNDRDRKNLLSTYGALFFGVPTQGMNVEAIAGIVQDLPSRYISALLDQRDGFRLRQRQHEAFCKAFDYKDSKLFHFYELKKSPTVIQDPETKKWSRGGPPALLVSPASATCGRSWKDEKDHSTSLNGNHSDMVKFSEHGHDDYAIVQGVLREFIDQAVFVVKHRVERSSEALQSSEGLERQRCLQSLHFFEMHWRRNEIADPASGTCEWIVTHPNYIRWSEQKQGLLWIKGRPGVGKSTIMKHSLEVAEQKRGRDTILASYFFHARGALIQNSVLGLFRSILHQLLQKLPKPLEELSSLYIRRCKIEGVYETKWAWHETELQNFFKSSIVEAARTYDICLYIDALDECGEDVATHLVDLFQSFGSSLAVCFSCRHYPSVALGNGLEICVEDENNPDINSYIRTSIEGHIVPRDISNPIQVEIAAQSRGNFQWVVLVVPQVLKLYRKGNSLMMLKTKIKQIPPDLSDMYRELLGSIDEEDLSQSLCLIQWVLFSLRPLTLAELRFALVMNAEKSYTSIRKCQRSKFFSNTDEELERRVLSLSQGLVEACKLSQDLSNPHAHDNAVGVQFIHQSVKDYFLEGGLKLLDSDSSDVIGRGHFSLSRSCIRYLGMEEIRYLVLTGSKESYRSALAAFPFLDYSLNFWPLHSQEVEKQNMPQEDLLGLLWKPLGGTSMQTYNVHLERDSTLLHLASWYNLSSVVNAILEQDGEADLRDSYGQTPLSHAAQRGNMAVVRSLLDRQDVDPNSRDEHGRTPLIKAISFEHEALVKFLLDRQDIDPNSQDVIGYSPLFYAVRSAHGSSIRQLLLDHQNIDKDSQDKNGTPWCSDAFLCHNSWCWGVLQEAIKYIGRHH